MMNTFEFLPPGSRNPKFGVRPGVIFGPPMEFSRYYGKETDRAALRAVTDEIIAEIAKLSGQEYVNLYAKQVKRGPRKPRSSRRYPTCRTRILSMLSIASPGVLRRPLQRSEADRSRLCLMRVGVLTLVAADCPGLERGRSARGCAGVLWNTGSSSSGFATAGEGRLRPTRCRSTCPQVRGILPRGGTILGSSRTNQPVQGDRPRPLRRRADQGQHGRGSGVDALVVIGGEDTLGVAARR